MNIHSRAVVLLLGTSCLLGPGGWALACGDKFLLLARSIRFEEAYAARHPASVLVYVDPATGFSAVGKQVVTILTKAGHKPVTAEGKGALKEALKAGSFDVILADIADIESVDTDVKAAGVRPMVLPVVYNPTGKELEAAKKQYTCLLKAKGKDRHFLAVVNEVMRARVKGKELKCKRA